ncbi:MAG: GntR family transcriptional regulator [Pseudomonadota bacterium]
MPLDQPQTSTGRPAKRVPFEAIYEEIRRRIGLLDYPPGTLLREGELAAEFGVSRTPMREILHRLAFEGLVEAKNGVGTIVTSVDPAHYKDIYELRLKLAEMVGELSPRPVAPGHITAVEDLLARVRQLGVRRDHRAYWELNHELHFIIRELIGNEALRRLWDQYYFQVTRLWFRQVETIWQEVIEEFEAEVSEVLRALKAGDVRAVGLVQRNFIAFGMRRVIRALEDGGA